jgi:gingipain R1
MKSIFGKAIVAIFGAMMVCGFANAQGDVTIILEAHDVWKDGSGYQLLLDKDHNTYGTVIPEKQPLTQDCNVPADLFKEFEYKVPTDADPSCTPKHMVMDGEVSIKIPAGTYDYAVAAPQAGKKIWIAGNGGTGKGRADDFVFEAGKTYRFLMKRFGNYDGVELTVTNSGGTGVEEVKTAPTVLSVYPNPASDVLYITADKPAHSIRVYNVYGQEVAQATDANSINVANLPAGVYIVNADGKIARVIKE